MPTSAGLAELPVRVVGVCAQATANTCFLPEPKHTSTKTYEHDNTGRSKNTCVHEVPTKQYFVIISSSTHTDQKLESHMFVMLVHLQLKARDRPLSFSAQQHFVSKNISTNQNKYRRCDSRTENRIFVFAFIDYTGISNNE
jgi:hypothetical protein